MSNVTFVMFTLHQSLIIFYVYLFFGSFVQYLLHTMILKYEKLFINKN
jgi:hypothetical protein